MERIIIYPGRFQPMLSHHAEVFKQLQAKFPGEKVFIGTSDKVDGAKSPFNFKEKQLIATAQGLNPNEVLLAVPSPYQKEAYERYFDLDKVSVIFAVGEKDMAESPRFRFDNMDSETGLNMKLRPNKETGKIEPTYYQMINTYKQNPKSMNERGYIYVIDNIPGESNEIASASQFRKSLIDAPTKEGAKEIFSKQFKEYNESVFELIYNKLKGEQMNEDLKELKKLAGLSIITEGIEEAGPVEFDTPLKPNDITFAPVSKSSAVMSVANRFPEGADVNDPEVKKEQFLQELMRSPVALLSEINERIMPDDNGLAVSKKLSDIIDSMRESDLKDLAGDERNFVLQIVKKALKEMELSAGDDRDFDPETSSLESVELDSIRSDYGVEESEGPTPSQMSDEDLADMLKCSVEEVKADREGAEEAANDINHDHAIDNMSEGGNASDLMMTDCESWIEQCDDAEECIKGLEDLKLSGDDRDDEFANSVVDSYIEKIQDQGLEKTQAEILASAFSDEDQGMEEDSVPYSKSTEKDLADKMHRASDKKKFDKEEAHYYKLVTALENSEEDLAEVLGLSMEELDQELTELSIDMGKHMDDDRDEILHQYIENKCDEMKHESIEDTSNKALEAAMSELRTLAGLNS